MEGNNFLYEYAIIRVVPRVERQEFINAGLILFCKKKNVLLCKTFLNEKKLLCIDAAANCALMKKYLHAFEEIASGKAGNHKIAVLDVPSRFRWLSAARSTVIQCSPIHPGMSAGKTPEEVFEKLFTALVL